MSPVNVSRELRSILYQFQEEKGVMYNVINHSFDRDWIREGNTLLNLFSSANKSTLFCDM